MKIDKNFTEREKELLRQALDCHSCLKYVEGITDEEIIKIMEKLE